MGYILLLEGELNIRNHACGDSGSTFGTVVRPTLHLQCARMPLTVVRLVALQIFIYFGFRCVETIPEQPFRNNVSRKRKDPNIQHHEGLVSTNEIQMYYSKSTSEYMR